MKIHQKPYFITIEGIEGTGKSTALKAVHQLLEQAGIEHIVTREPGGTQIAEELRRVILTPHDEAMCEDTELLLMFGARAQHIHQVIKPALDKGVTVLCDRFTDATYAYQGGGRGIAYHRIAEIERWVQGTLRPDLVLLLDAPVEVGLARIQKRQSKDRIEREELDFFNRVRRAYLQRAKEYPDSFRVIDASGTPREVAEKLRQVLNHILHNEDVCT